MRLPRHDFYLAGGGGGWEVWRCARCDRWTIPTLFGLLWPEILGRFFRRFACRD